MSEEQQPSILELQARWDKIRIANLYDTLDKMGYPNQCLDLGIRPLFPRQHLAGVAITVRGSRDPRSHEERKADAEKAKAEGKQPAGPPLHELLFPGCVVVVDGGGEPYTGNAYTAPEVPRIPWNLVEAMDAWEGSKFAKDAFGEDVHFHVLHSAREEWRAFNNVVTEWELRRNFERI